VKNSITDARDRRRVKLVGPAQTPPARTGTDSGRRNRFLKEIDILPIGACPDGPEARAKIPAPSELNISVFFFHRPARFARLEIGTSPSKRGGDESVPHPAANLGQRRGSTLAAAIRGQPGLRPWLDGRWADRQTSKATLPVMHPLDKARFGISKRTEAIPRVGVELQGGIEQSRRLNRSGALITTAPRDVRQVEFNEAKGMPLQALDIHLRWLATGTPRTAKNWPAARVFLAQPGRDARTHSNRLCYRKIVKGGGKGAAAFFFYLTKRKKRRRFMDRFQLELGRGSIKPHRAATRKSQRRFKKFR